MKKATKIVTIISMILLPVAFVENCIYLAIYRYFIGLIFNQLMQDPSITEELVKTVNLCLGIINIIIIVGIIFMFLCFIAGLIIGIFALKSLNKEMKIALGVLLILFTSIPSGILYLICRSKSNNNVEVVAQKEDYAYEVK